MRVVFVRTVFGEENKTIQNQQKMTNVHLVVCFWWCRRRSSTEQARWWSMFDSFWGKMGHLHNATWSFNKHGHKHSKVGDSLIFPGKNQEGQQQPTPKPTILSLPSDLMASPSNLKSSTSSGCKTFSRRSQKARSSKASVQLMWWGPGVGERWGATQKTHNLTFFPPEKKKTDEVTAGTPPKMETLVAFLVDDVSAHDSLRSMMGKKILLLDVNLRETS